MKQFTILKKLISFFGVLVFIWSPAFVSAQDFCGVDQIMKELYEKHPELKEDHKKLFENNRKFIQEKNGRSSNVYTIPVVFHILHEYGAENITDQQVRNQVERLNKDFRNLSADTTDVVPAYKALIADSRIEFVLPTVDYQGNCTNGIDRINTHETRNGDDYSKLNPWPREKYLNVWVAAKLSRPGVAGYAYYPSAVTGGWMYFVDGIMIQKDYINGASRVLTHEVGHYLGLSHTWGSTNDPEVACGDDGIPDTPITKGWKSCSLNNASVCYLESIAKPYSFASVTSSTGNTDPTPVPADTGIVFGSFSATGVSTNSAKADTFSFTGWDLGANDGDNLYTQLTGSINTAKYYEVTITPKLGYDMTLSKIEFNFSRNLTGVRTYAVRSSADNYASNLAASIVPLNSNYSIEGQNIFFLNKDTTSISNIKSTVTLSGAAYTNRLSPITFRIYGWNAEDVLGTFEIDNVVVSLTNGAIENIQNYMEYAYCSRMFTIGQAEFMEATLNNNTADRDNLSTSSNLAATGSDVATAPICAPVADFAASSTYVCQGSTITFNNASWRAEVDSYSWTFKDGTPATATTANPIVTFNTPGWKTVTLSVTNATGTDTKTMENYVYVSPGWSDFEGTHNESFESTTGPWWIADNPGNDTVKFELMSWGTTGKAFGLKNVVDNPSQFYYARLGGKRDALVSPSYDLRYMQSGEVSFTFACATRGMQVSEITEDVKVYFSLDCGKTWGAPRFTIAGIDLITAGVVDGSFVPSNSNQWKTVSVNIPSSFYKANVRFKFEYTASDNSNNFYIDNVTVGGVVGVEEQLAKEYFSLNIFPNPTKDDQTLNVSYFSSGDDVKITISDLVGKVVYNVNENKGSGKNTTIISMSDAKMKAGVYFLSISDGVHSQTKKVVVY